MKRKLIIALCLVALYALGPIAVGTFSQQAAILWSAIITGILVAAHLFPLPASPASNNAALATLRNLSWKSTFVGLFLFALALWLISIGAQPNPDDKKAFEALKTKIQARAVHMDELRSTGKVKETKDGQVEKVVGKDLTPAQESLVRQENTDREKMFPIIARLSGKKKEEVRDQFIRMLPPPPPPGVDQPPKLDFTRVLSKSHAYLYSAPDVNASKAELPPFKVCEILSSQTGWYKVTNNQRIHGKGVFVGWLREEDAVPWRHALGAIYESNRPPRELVLMFKGLPGKSSGGKLPTDEPSKEMLELVHMDEPDRKIVMDTIYAETKVPDTSKKPLLAKYSVEAMEPKKYTEITGTNENGKKKINYILPIVAHKEVEFGAVKGAGQAGLLLQLAAMTQNRGKNAIDVSEDTKERMQKAKLDIIFVMDLTNSMQPFVDKTREGILKFIKILGDDKVVGDVFRFGFWGYRDDPTFDSHLRFTENPNPNAVTHNYTPQLQTAEEMYRILSTVTVSNETRNGGDDFPEDVLKGVLDAISDETAWRTHESAGRIMFLVGDAPGRNPQLPRKDGKMEKGTFCSMSDQALAGYIKYERKIRLGAFYWLSSLPSRQAYNKTGFLQFSLLSNNVAVGIRSDEETYLTHFERAAEIILQGVRKIHDRPNTDIGAPLDRKNILGMTGDESGKSLFNGFMMDWLSRNRPEEEQGKMPNDVIAWAADKDLSDSARRALTPALMLTRTQLNNLYNILRFQEDVILERQKTKDGWFKAMKEVMRRTTTNPDDLEKGIDELKPDFLVDLPYKSKFQKKTQEDFENNEAHVGDELLQDIRKAQDYYKKRTETDSEWQPLDRDDPNSEEVTFLPLDYLP